jgi:Putative DNA-binding domain
MIPYPLSKIDASVLCEICSSHFSESPTLDFKAILPAGDEKGKVELAKDVCALANADGGDLVFGIAEDAGGGAANAVSPITGVTYDEASRRMTSIIDSGIEPKIRGIEHGRVDVDGGYVLILRVPASFEGPHCLRNHNDQRRFVTRNGTTTTDMSYEQIRMAFDRTASLGESARQLIAQRLMNKQNGQHWRPMRKAPHAVFEMIPLAGLSGRTKIDIKKVDVTALNLWSGGLTQTINLDGPVVYSASGEEDGIWGMSQFYRDCGVSCTVVAGTDKNSTALRGVWMEAAYDIFLQALTGSLTLLQKTGVSGPAIARCALMNTLGCLADDGKGAFRSKKSDRDHMWLPEIWIEEISTAPEPAEILEDTLEVMYQAFGFPSAPRKR